LKSQKHLRGRVGVISGVASDDDDDDDDDVSYGEHGRYLDPLRALCQTSQTLRAVCLPLLWERIHVYYCRRNGPDHSDPEVIRSRLYRISSGLIENRTLAAYVRVFNFFVQTDNAALISKLIACLSILPNMHTLSAHGNIFEFSRRFSQATFPQVRTLFLPACNAGYIVPCCPQVRAVISRARMKGWTNLVGLFDDAGDTLEVLDGFLMSPEIIEYLIETTRNLKVVKFPDWVSPDTIMLFKPLMKLHTIEMVATHYHHRRQRQKPKSDGELDMWMSAAKEVLAGHEGRNGQIRGGKRIRMCYRLIGYDPAVPAKFQDVEVD